MMTYSVKADNNNTPKISYEVTELPAKSALFLANHLFEAFCRVEVICEQTGEITYQSYYNSDFRKPTMEELTCLSIAQSILKD
jgi:hypothetical protein